MLSPLGIISGSCVGYRILSRGRDNPGIKVEGFRNWDTVLGGNVDRIKLVGREEWVYQ